MAVQNVALLGADGKLGPAILHALISNGFNVTVQKRVSSKSEDNYPSGVKVARIPDDLEINATSKALQGQDALVISIKGSQVDEQIKLAEACVKAKVKRMIPADFGSCDSSTKRAQDLIPLFKSKAELRAVLTELADQNSSFSWTSLVCGHFYDWSAEFLHVWVKERKIDVIDDGTDKWSASTLSRIGEATARILQKPEATANKMIYVQSFSISQNDMVKAFEKATGDKWHINRLDSAKYEKQEKPKMDAGEFEARENLVWLLGTLDGNWEVKENFAMKTLGLENENLEEVTARVVKDSS